MSDSSFDESVFSKSLLKSMKQLESQFNYLDLTNKQKKNSIRAQAFETAAVVIAAAKNHKEMKRFRRKSRLSIDSADSENITMPTSTIEDSVLQKIDEVLDAQDVSISQVVERMDIMETTLTRLTAISLRIEVKLNQDERSGRHHTKERANSRGFEHSADSQSSSTNTPIDPLPPPYRHYGAPS